MRRRSGRDQAGRTAGSGFEAGAVRDVVAQPGRDEEPESELPVAGKRPADHGGQHRANKPNVRLLHLVKYNENRTAGPHQAAGEPSFRVAQTDIDLENVQVHHNEAENRFETWIDGKLSKLDYLLDGDAFVIMHVGVHPDFRGQGLAARITQASLEYARERSLRVIPMCSYAAAYIRKHSEYQVLTRQHPAE